MGLPRLPRDTEGSNLRWQLRHLVSADIGGATTRDKVDTNTSNTDSRSEPSLGGRFAINSRDVALSQRARLYLLSRRSTMDRTKVRTQDGNKL